MDIEAYLDRIGYRGPRTATLDTLRDLHRAHLLSVPFENLDIQAGRPIVLDRERLFDKIVRRRRGGFCYELNGLLATFLEEMGFRVTLLSAGVARETGGFSPEFDHLALCIHLESDWLADVGFGESILDPVPFGNRAQVSIAWSRKGPHGSFSADRSRATASRSSRARSRSSPACAIIIRPRPTVTLRKTASSRRPLREGV